MSELVLTECRDLQNGRVGILRMNRPQQLNPLDKDTVTALDTAMDGLLADPLVRAVVVTGEGKAFSAGGDLSGYLDLYLDEERFRHFLAAIRRFFGKLENSRLLSVAAVNGTCVAGGFEMALACDLIVMSSSARMGDGHLQYWQLPGGGGTQRLPRAIGFTAAKQMLYSYELFDAERCRSFGLTAATFGPERFLEDTLTMVDRLITTRPETVLALKKLLQAAASEPLEQGLTTEIETIVGHAVGEASPAYQGLLRFATRKQPAKATALPSR